MPKQKRYVEIGRIVYIAYGPDKGKICAIVDVLDQNRALVEGPCTNVKRKIVNFKAVQLTPFRVKFGHSTSSKIVKAAWEEENIDQKWNETVWAKKIEAKAKRQTLGDFDRFKLMKAKQARNRIIKVEYNKLKKIEVKAKTKIRQAKLEAKNHKRKIQRDKAKELKKKIEEGKAAKEAKKKSQPKTEAKKGKKAKPSE